MYSDFVVTYYFGIFNYKTYERVIKYKLIVTAHNKEEAKELARMQAEHRHGKHLNFTVIKVDPYISSPLTDKNFCDTIR